MLRFAVFAALLVGLLVFVVVPLFAGPLIGSVLQGNGLRAQSLTAQVGGSPLGLVTGRAEELRLRGRDVELGAGALAGTLDLTLGNVSLGDRSFSTVTGELRDVLLRAADGETARIQLLVLSGPAPAADASAFLTAAESERLVLRAAVRGGVPLDGVRLTAGGVEVTVGGITAEGALSVREGSLVVGAAGFLVPILIPADDLPFLLERVAVAADGVRVDGTIDVRALAGDAALAGDVGPP